MTDTEKLKTYKVVLSVEIDVQGDFPSRRAFDTAIEKMWEQDGYYTVAQSLGLDIEENLEDTIDVDVPLSDDDVVAGCTTCEEDILTDDDAYVYIPETGEYFHGDCVHT